MNLPKRKNPKRVLWQGKHLDGFLLIVLDSQTKVSGTLYAPQIEFKLYAELHPELLKEVPPRIIVEEFISTFDKEYLESEVERCKKGQADGTCTLQ